MNRLVNAHTWSGGFGLVVFVLTIALAGAGACSTPSETNEDKAEDQVIGKPPEADEDPFFVESMPGEAVEAAPSGSIGDEEDEPPTSADDEDGEDLTSRAPERPQTPDQPQCFSCVRICPAEGDCEQAKEDVICGWGVHETADHAKRMAKAECDATLDMARQMPVWSEIAGECPAATCR